MDHSLLDRPGATSPARRRHRRRPTPRPAWSCENCSLPNAGTRKRCRDCGTSRD